MVSERFKEVVERYGLKNAWFIPAEKFAWDKIGGGSGMC
jgi:hypothetical protein